PGFAGGGAHVGLVVQGKKSDRTGGRRKARHGARRRRQCPKERQSRENHRAAQSRSDERRTVVEELRTAGAYGRVRDAKRNRTGDRRRIARPARRRGQGGNPGAGASRSHRRNKKRRGSRTVSAGKIFSRSVESRVAASRT